MGRHLNELSPRFRPLAVELIARAAEAKIPLLITCTGRTQAEQDAAFASGASQVRHSTHQDGDAIDVVPYEQFQAHGPDKLLWDTRSIQAVAIWLHLGKIGKDLGLRWGGTFGPISRETGLGWDPGHFEYPPPPKEDT